MLEALFTHWPPIEQVNSFQCAGRCDAVAKKEARSLFVPKRALVLAGIQHEDEDALRQHAVDAQSCFSMDVSNESNSDSREYHNQSCVFPLQSDLIEGGMASNE